MPAVRFVKMDEGGPSYENFQGKDVTVRLEDGTEVQGHVGKWGEDTEGHAGKWGIELEVFDTEANMLQAATDRGESVYVRLPDEAEVKGHAYKR
ncbi:MAG: hypothetical protein ABR529_09100 [Actinomycetota bacterium]